MRTLLLALPLLVLTACGGSDDPADAPLPDYNPDAKFNGKTVMEYAQGLDDLNPRMQLTALQAIAKFKVDGLPARDKVKAALEASKDDRVKLAALAVLSEMKAPEAHHLIREKLRDPKFFESARSYGQLLSGAKQVGVDEAALKGDVLKLAGSNRAHRCAPPAAPAAIRRLMARYPAP